MRAYDERGQVYYIDTVTKRHQWTHPLMATLGSQRSLRSAPSPTPSRPATPQQQAAPQQQLQAPPTLRQQAMTAAANGTTFKPTGSGYFAHFKTEVVVPSEGDVVANIRQYEEEEDEDEDEDDEDDEETPELEMETEGESGDADATTTNPEVGSAAIDLNVAAALAMYATTSLLGNFLN